MALTTNTFGVAKWVVSPDSTQGTHTTISSAIASASSGDTIFIRNGTYTENPTLTPGVNLCALSSDYNGNVILNGTLTMTGAGSSAISGINLQTNSNFALVVSGSSATVLIITNCNLSCTNNTGINFTSSSASSTIEFINCIGSVVTAGTTLFTHSSLGSLVFLNCSFDSLNNTASTCSSGGLFFEFCSMALGVIGSGTSSISLYHSVFQNSNINIGLTFGGSGAQICESSSIFSGTSSSISCGSTLPISNCVIDSTNTNAITGSGVLSYSGLSFQHSNVINTTTRVATMAGTWTPTMIGGTIAGITTYSIQQGSYILLGNGLVYIQGVVTGSAATGTGNATIGGLPFTVNSANGAIGSILILNGVLWVWPAGSTSACLDLLSSTSNAVVYCSGSTVTGGNLQMVNSAFNFQFSAVYQIS